MIWPVGIRTGTLLTKQYSCRGSTPEPARAPRGVAMHSVLKPHESMPNTSNLLFRQQDGLFVVVCRLAKKARLLSTLLQELQSSIHFLRAYNQAKSNPHIEHCVHLLLTIVTCVCISL